MYVFILGYIMKQTLQQLLYNYSYITDVNILQNLLTKIDDTAKENIKSIEDLQKLLYKLNQKIQIKDVLSHLFVLESNINIINSSLSSKDDEYSSDLKCINQQNQKLLREIFVMLDSRELKDYWQLQ